MNLFQLKATVAAYHQRTAADLTINSVDLFLVALNNATKWAQKEHDFENCRCTATLAIDGVTGGALTAAVISPTGVFSGIRAVVDVSGMRLAGDFVPFDFTRVDVAIERDRAELELSDDYWPTNRYPSDAQILARSSSSTLVLRGGSIYQFPRVATTTQPPVTVYLEAYGWLNDYVAGDLTGTGDPPKDFLVANGFDFLQWSTIIELNYICQTFVPRQEGNPGSPEKMKKDAWDNLILWDSYTIDPFATRSR